MDLPDLEELAIPVVRVTTKKKLKREQKPSRRFLKGPIRWEWLARAGTCKGSALQVAIALAFEAGVTKSKVVRLPHARLREMKVDRNAARRGLREMEELGLVLVERPKGKSPIVTLVGHDLEREA